MALCLKTNAVKSQTHDSCRGKKWVINVSVFCELVYILVLSQVKVSTNFIKSTVLCSFPGLSFYFEYWL